jgi:hypothetical protein
MVSPPIGGGQLRGVPSEGNPAPVAPFAGPGYVEGPTPNTGPSVPPGNPMVNTMVPAQRDVRGQREGNW